MKDTHLSDFLICGKTLKEVEKHDHLIKCYGIMFGTMLQSIIRLIFIEIIIITHQVKEELYY